MSRGFIGLSREQVIENARKGGKAAQASGRARRWDTESAREAGRKGAAKRLENLRKAKETAAACEAAGADEARDRT